MSNETLGNDSKEDSSNAVAKLSRRDAIKRIASVIGLGMGAGTVWTVLSGCANMAGGGGGNWYAPYSGQGGTYSSSGYISYAYSSYSSYHSPGSSFNENRHYYSVH